MARFEAAFLAVNRWLLILMLGTMSVIVFANVVLRYSTSYSIEWSEEVARHLLIWLTFLGCGPVLRYGGHIAVENLQDVLPRRAAILLRMVVAALITLLLVLLIYFGLQYVDRTQYQQTPVTQIPFSYIYLALPIGAALTIVHFLLIIRGYLLERRFAADEHFDATASASL
jgi:TRAP-type transport system small permease protein